MVRNEFNGGVGGQIGDGTDFVLNLARERDTALDALQEMCRSHCAWRCGHYDPMGSQTAYDALEVLVQAGRLEWLGDESLGRRRCAKDKEA